MVDVIHKLCEQENCKKHPAFNYPNEKVGIYCKEHATTDMVDVIHKLCEQENCKKHPAFNYPNEKIAIFCKEHATIDMVDVIHKRCEQENCKKHQAFNYPNEKIAIFCKEHAIPSMVDVIHKHCIECNDTRVNDKYKDHCLRCFIYKFPDEKISRNYKVKEIHMTDFIKENFKDEIIIFDKTVGGCSKRRPDFYIDKFTHVLIGECDENKHETEEYTSCDNKRTMELFQDFGNRPIVFIRFNPDAYTKGNKTVLSSFKNHKTTGVPIIRDLKEWGDRLVLLKETTTYWLNNIPEKEITYEYLFFDQ